MTTGGQVIRILASAGIAVATLYGVFLADIHYSFTRSTTLAVVCLALAIWGVTAVLVPAWRPRSRILPALVVPLAVLALATATSRQPRLGLDFVAWSTILVSLYLLLVRLMASPTFRPRMLALITATAIGVGLWYLLAVGVLWIEWWGYVGRLVPPPLRPEFASLTFGNPSAVMLMSILLTLPAVAWVGFGSRRRTALSMLLLALAASTTLLSGSRSGWLGLAIGWTVAGALWLLRSNHRAWLASVVRSRRLRIALASGGLAAVAVGVVVLPGILLRAGSGGEGLRLAYWQAAVRMFSEAPVLGTGPGTWVAQRIAYTETPATDYYIPHAHDLYLQTLAESGLVGALAGVVLVIVVGGLLARAVRSHDRDRAWMGWAAILALAYYAGHQLLDFYPPFPPSLIAVAIPIAWLDAAEEQATVASRSTAAPPSVKTRAGALALAGGGVVAIVLAAAYLRWNDQWAPLNESAVHALNDARPADALEPARAAVAGDPAMTPYQVTLGLAASKTGHPDEAAAAFSRAAAADDFPVSWLGLAAARVELGDRAGALEALGRALRLGIAQPAIAIGAADLYGRLGETGRADSLVLAALTTDPRLAAAPNLPGSNREALIDRALAAAGPVGGFLMALEAGRPEAARAALDQLIEPARTRYARILAAWEGDASALRALEDELRDRPLDLELVNWVGRLAERQQPGAGRPYVRWGNIVNGNSGLFSREIRIESGEGPPGGVGFTSQFYGLYTYNRPTPWDLTPGGLPRIVTR